MSCFTDVCEFHDKFGVPVPRSQNGNQPPGFPSEDVIAYRLKFIHEELTELEDAIKERDLTGVADALADLCWVSLGTAAYFGIPFDQVWKEVRRANMAKVRIPRGDDPLQKNWRVDVIAKPAGWKPPDLEAVFKREAFWHGGVG